jgi:hypothetical protein
MATRTIKLREQEGAPQEQEIELERLSQRKRPELGRFLLQIDRQTKRSFAKAEDAEAAGLVVKQGYPKVQVVVYDRIDSVHKLVELPTA